MADETRTHIASHRLILHGADGYDEARYARVFNARRADRHPPALFVDYLAGPDGFRNLNGWERN